MVGVAIVGMALGLLVYQRNQKDVRSALTGGANEDE